VSDLSPSPRELYSKLVEILLSHPEVSQSKKSGFGSGLRVNGKIFAMLSKGKLVVRLPDQRMNEIIASGNGEPYTQGQNRPTKEWLIVESTSEDDWIPLAMEAMEFVTTKS